jgi:hypothetical protein
VLAQQAFWCVQDWDETAEATNGAVPVLCRFRKLYPAVAMMKPSKDWSSDNGTAMLDGPAIPSILVQAEVRS